MYRQLRNDINKLKKQLKDIKTVDAIFIDCVDEQDLQEKINELCIDPSKAYCLMRSDFKEDDQNKFAFATEEEKKAHMLSLGLLV